MSNVQKVKDLLVTKGLTLSEKEIATRVGVSGNSVRAIVSRVRRQGFPIYLNEGSKDARGRVKASRYRYGQATKAMVAAFYAQTA
jgi:transposase